MRLGNFNIGMNDKDEERLNKFYENAAYINMAPENAALVWT